MNKVAFSSWDGKIADYRKGKSAKPAKGKEPVCPVQYDGMKMKAMMGWNGMVVLDESADIPALTLGYLKEARKLSCGECSVCMIGIDRVMDILETVRAGRGSAQDLAEIETIAKGVAENAKCNFGRASALVPVMDAVKYFKADFLAKDVKKEAAKAAYGVSVTAPCMQACPAALDIPGYIELIRNNKFKESLNLIRERCILPGVIGRACTHPCEDACVRKDMDASLSIRLLKKAAADFELKEGAGALAVSGEEKKEKVAVIGAGPAGLAAAYHLRKMGYQVTVFEALPKGGGMAAVGIPDYRLPKDILNHEIDLIKRTGVDIRLNCRIDKMDWADMQKKGYKAAYLAIGAHVGTKVGCGGEDIASDDFVQGAEFLRRFSLGEKIAAKNRVVIIGGGNVALDCARSCVRLGFKDVQIVYRRSRNEMPASKIEIEEAEQEGVKFSFLKAPVNIVRKAGKVTGIECIKMKLGEPDASGRKRPIPIKGSESTIATDMIIAATGQKPDVDLLKGKNAVQLTDWGTITAKAAAGFETNVAGIFAGGDCVSGPATLIEALNMGNKAAQGIDAYIQGKTVPAEISLGGLNTKTQRNSGFVPKEAAAGVAFLEPKTRLHTFAEVEGAFGVPDAIKEAGRCLRCYRLMIWE